ncbi:hypothetical protein OPT61_g9954 [Boeremia exigua]|uniref:Uncharacterized protein n=1 Tax=Boeremia exigua TaxID=749465 RepID=A0ACC2HSW9_9PLEO|nr:hypothetical protein OPT61_g9954 [Boeremia exigua]
MRGREQSTATTLASSQRGRCLRLCFSVQLRLASAVSDAFRWKFVERGDESALAEGCDACQMLCLAVNAGQHQRRNTEIVGGDKLLAEAAAQQTRCASSTEDMDTIEEACCAPPHWEDLWLRPPATPRGWTPGRSAS